LSVHVQSPAIATWSNAPSVVIERRFGAGLSLAETADVMRRSENAVKNLQHNALVSLRRRLLTVESDR
jgi:DNA-directed RNA polymerase specialized sigma24 family protein